MTFASCFFLLFSVAIVLPAETPDWENEQVIGHNKLPGRTTAFPFPDKSSAMAASQEQATWLKSLNGDWQFHWSPDPASRPAEVLPGGL